MVGRMVRDERGTIAVSAAREVEELFLELAGVSVDMAPEYESWTIRKGWVTAAAWIDQPIDDPRCRPVMDAATSMAVHRVLCRPSMDIDLAHRVQRRLDGRLRVRDMSLLECAYTARVLLVGGATRNRTNLVSGLAPKVVHAMHAYLCT